MTQLHTGNEAFLKDPNAVMPFEIINSAPSTKSGGSGGSITKNLGTEKDKKFWQYKFSFFNKKGKDWRKAKVKGGTDHENIGELIAGCIGQVVASKVENGERIFSIATPEIRFVGVNEATRGQNQGVNIASKFLEKFAAFGTLVGVPEGEKDKLRYLKLNFVDSKKTREPRRDYSVRNDGKYIGHYDVTEPEVKKGISEGVAFNMLFGNTDINAKGNIGLVKGGVGCVDFGHGFNNLIHRDGVLGHLVRGGGVKNKQNGILDFINRPKVLGGASKLWRDYNGLIPSQEFAAALHKMADCTKEIEQGVKNARERLKTFAAELKTPKEKKMFLASLQRLNRNIGIKDKVKGDLDAVIKATIDNMQTFCTKLCEQMKQVAQLMELQAEIDKGLKQGMSVDSLVKDRRISDLCSRASNSGKIEWVKTSKKEKPFVGDLTGYIKQREQELVKETIKELAESVGLELSSIKTSKTISRSSSRSSSLNSSVLSTPSSSVSSTSSSTTPPKGAILERISRKGWAYTRINEG